MNNNNLSVTIDPVKDEGKAYAKKKGEKKYKSKETLS